MISYEFFGTSHGRGYGGIVSGLPDGFIVDVECVNEQLRRRKTGYGRSARQQYDDIVRFVGQRDGKLTIGGTVEFFVPNHADNNKPLPDITALRAGHADIVGQARFPDMTARQVEEIASARNSVCYVVLGAICKQILDTYNVFTYSFTKQIGNVACNEGFVRGVSDKQSWFDVLHCPSQQATAAMAKAVDNARQNKDSLGGVCVVCAEGVPMGLGEIVPYTQRLDAVIAGALAGIPSVKCVGFGDWRNYSGSTGRQLADKLTVDNDKIVYDTNVCGGIVGGLSTGKTIVAELVVKPIPTVDGVETVDSVTYKAVRAHVERADTCVVPNVGVIAENMLATVLLDQMIKQGLI